MDDLPHDLIELVVSVDDGLLLVSCSSSCYFFFEWVLWLSVRLFLHLSSIKTVFVVVAHAKATLLQKNAKHNKTVKNENKLQNQRPSKQQRKKWTDLLVCSIESSERIKKYCYKLWYADVSQVKKRGLIKKCFFSLQK